MQVRYVKRQGDFVEITWLNLAGIGNKIIYIKSLQITPSGLGRDWV